MLVTKTFNFDAAHYLTDYYGKCERMHGHTYTLEVTLEGKIQPNGLVIDFVVLKRLVKKHVLNKLDHHVLNDVIENPSAERVIMWIWNQLLDLPKLLKEEMDDPNLSHEIKVYLKTDDQEKTLDKSKFNEELKLYEIKLWETPNSCVSYKGV